MTKILSLEAENVLRVRHVEIVPRGNVVEITGKNEQGKSSILAFWLALKQTAVENVTEVIRKGEERAKIRLKLGDGDTVQYIVERRFGPGGTTLYVESPDGARFRSPQALLDSMVGALSVDPLDFSRAKPAQRLEILKRLVTLDVDVEQIESHKKALYEQRAEVNRNTARFKAAAASVQTEELLTPIDINAILAEGREASEMQEKVRNHNANLRVAQSRVEAQRDRIAELRVNLAKLEANLEKEVAVLEALGEPLDVPAVEDMSERIAEASKHNRRVEEQKAAIIAGRQAEASEEESKRLTEKMEELEREKQAAIAAAKFPIDGLGFGDGDVTFQGLPIGQASSAARIRIGMAIAMAMNPQLRVIRILDGSLLDADSWAEIEKMAAEKDYQVWIETVSSQRPTAFVVHDGQIVSNPTEESAA